MKASKQGAKKWDALTHEVRPREECWIRTLKRAPALVINRSYTRLSSPQERERLINDTMRFMVLRGCGSQDPVSLEKIKAAVAGEYQGLIPTVLHEANRRLGELFGFRISNPMKRA